MAKCQNPLRDLSKRDPGYWVPSTERTTARIVYDQRKIYFGFECFDSEPHKIVANNMRRDSQLWGDDNVQILLDTYNDRQTGAFFFVNSLGAKRDLILSRKAAPTTMIGIASGKPKDTGTTKGGRLKWQFHSINCDLRTKKMRYGVSTSPDLLPAKPNRQH